MDATPFGRYRLLESFGRSAMGEVWRAEDTVLDREVALRILPENLTDDPVFEQRFRREVGAWARLEDSHVVPIHDFGEEEGHLFLSKRLIEGNDLQQLIDEERGLAPARAVRIIAQIASALNAAHRIDLVHGDVRPSNILVTENDFCYITDFGIAHAAAGSGLTTTGRRTGSWGYLAPEWFKKRRADAQADIYALTCVLYQSLTGLLPFRAVGLEEIVMAHKTQPPPRPSAYDPGIPPALDAVIATGMAKDPEDRYATTLELARAARGAMTMAAAAQQGAHP